MSEYYNHDITEYPSIMAACISDAISRAHAEGIKSRIQDIRLWVQKWKDTSCGFGVEKIPVIDGSEGEFTPPKYVDTFPAEITTLAPTIIIKFNRGLRYVYHNGKFAYAIKGRVSITYYDAMNLRSLPGASDAKKRYLMDGSF